MDQQTGFKSGKDYIKAVYCHPAYLTYMQSTSCKMPGWMKHIVKAMVCPIVMDMCKLDHKEGWVSKNWCFQTVVLEKTLESPLDSKEINPVNPNGNQPWIFIGRTDAEAPILGPPDAKNWLTGKDPDAGKEWRQEEKGMTEDEMVGWHHRLNGHGFEQAPGDGDGQGGLVCCSPWGCKKSETNEQLN